jgi:ATP-dependent exoDNAse (exonuclease V) alpha subunit
MFHLSLRVPWHDNGWNGTVCKKPTCNSFCAELDRIAGEKQAAGEELLAGQHFSILKHEEQPPCRAESVAFMSDREWQRLVKHPYQDSKQCLISHGHLRPTSITVPAFATFAVPFWWMLTKNQDAIDAALAEPLPPEEPAPFPSPWVFGRGRQEALVKLFFEQRLKVQESLVLFYAKASPVLGDMTGRIVVGIGSITKIPKVIHYEGIGRSPTYPLWDRIIHHSIRPDGKNGFLLPYQQYLEPTGDSELDARLPELLSDIAVSPPEEHTRDFSYAAELVTPSVALTTLKACLDSVRKIKEHGIAKGPWDERIEWLNAQIDRAWKERGAFPGAGAALEAFGLKLGTSLMLDLRASELVKREDDPWPLLDAILSGTKQPPHPAYEPHLSAKREEWVKLKDERRILLKLLSRFDLSPKQAASWFVEKRRLRAAGGHITDSEVLDNPYRVAESDLGIPGESPISVTTMDQGLLPDPSVAKQHPVPLPSRISSDADRRRIRAALVAVLRAAATEGDSLLSESEVMDCVEKLSLSRPVEVTGDWLNAHASFLGEIVDQLPLRHGDISLPAIQLKDLRRQEDQLRKILIARAAKVVPAVGEEWEQLVKKTLKNDKRAEVASERSQEATREQSGCLEIVTRRRLSLLTGKAGTGKTTVMGALFKSQKLKVDGILLLAPTGKARVRLASATGAEAMTVAQFLNKHGRYDAARQIATPFSQGDLYAAEKTVIIDEASMLTMNDLLAVLNTLDLTHVTRIILVGDPNQLPPIGVGRPFADLVGHFRVLKESADDKERLVGNALVELTVEVRTILGDKGAITSDALRLARLFAAGALPVDADSVLSELGRGELNDVSAFFWSTPEQLQSQMLQALMVQLGLKNSQDVAGFNQALGLNPTGWLDPQSNNSAERFQILSPVRMHPYGVSELNRWMHQHFRADQLAKARKRWAVSIGDEELVVSDKVIQLINEERSWYCHEKKEKGETYLANGEVGVVVSEYKPKCEGKPCLRVVFAGRAGVTFSYWPWSESQRPPLQLAYALTVHKAQGSDFDFVFVVIPKRCRNLTRELLYTALTRARQHLVLLIEGDTAQIINDVRQHSDTASRNTNLFCVAIREGVGRVPYAEHLIHRTERGELVRSKSELVIANLLHHRDIAYHYEKPLQLPSGQWIHPDFSFADPSGDTVVWEHLGMMSKREYSEGWQRRKAQYLASGYVMGESLFTSEDGPDGSLNAQVLAQTAAIIRERI